MELRLFLTLCVLFFLPGAALLTIGGAWRRWPGLQRYMMAIGLSIAFFPLLYYTVRFWLPFLRLNTTTLMIILAASLAIVIWGLWRNGLAMIRIGGLEWVAVGVFLLTLFSRVWFAHALPFPAWSDSLHHVMLTQLTVEQGQLPTGMQPYYPVDFGMYHLGLYALAAPTMQLAQASAPLALLWTAQFLNAACVLGVYLALDRYSGRVGAIVGAAIVGLFSVHPALYANWGRFTQVASQAILLIAWVATVEAVSRWATSAARAEDASGFLRHRLWESALAAGLTAAVFLLHFRVGAFYVLLLAISMVHLLWQARAEWRQLRATLIGMVTMGLVALFLIFPTLWVALRVYFDQIGAATQITLSSEERANSIQNYFVFPWSSVPYLVAPRWLLGTTIIAAIIGLLRRSKLVIIALIWALLLFLLGNAYLTGIKALRITNLGAILIMYYMPISLIIGVAVHELLALLPAPRRGQVGAIISIGVLLLGVWGARARATHVEKNRHFVQPADLTAMAWINENIPDDTTFAINTYFWLPRAPHGVDAGYWLPYLTGNETTAPAMIIPREADPALMDQFVAQSHLVERLESDLDALNDLYAQNIRYIYIGSIGDSTGPGLQSDFLRQSDRVQVRYAQDGVTILEILPEDS